MTLARSAAEFVSETRLPRQRWFGARNIALMQSLKTSLGRLRVIGMWEGVSFLLLLGVAMPLKYFAGYPQAVRIVGMAHGILFLLYVLAAIHAALEHNWPWKRTALVLIASVLPAGPFVVDARILREEAKRLGES
jgi:integral membrane protein